MNEQVENCNFILKYDKQDQQGKAAFNARNPHMTQQQVSQGQKL
jgi:hypothetical protein